MAHECKTFYKRLAQMISEKRSIDCSTATNFVRTKISFSLLRSTLMSIRGSRSFKRDFDFTDIEQSPTSLPIFGRWNNYIFFFQAEDGIRDAQESRGLGDVYKRQSGLFAVEKKKFLFAQSSWLLNNQWTVSQISFVLTLSLIHI